METNTAMPVKLTNTAKEELRRLFNNKAEGSTQMLRIGVKGGGCSGFSYVLEMDEKNGRRKRR